MAVRTFPSYWIYRDTAGGWRWTYEARNGRTIAVSSEAYNRRADCEHSINLVKNSSNDSIWYPSEELMRAP